MSEEFDIDDLERRMRGALSNLRDEFGGLRTGRASASLLDPITVDAYGSQMPISKVGTVSVPEPRMNSEKVWDKGLVASVEKAIRDSSLGLNPAADGTLVRVPIPELNEERRRELGKVANQYAENARVSVRNVRRDGMEQLKKLKSDGMSEDENKIWSEEVQELTDKVIGEIDQTLEQKESEIMQV